MDERHLWIAGRIKNAFDNADNHNQSAIEEFMLQEEILDKVNYFLSSNGSSQLFFYYDEFLGTAFSVKGLKCGLALDSETISSNTNGDKEKKEIVLLYLFRLSTQLDVPLTQFEKELFVGTLRGKVLDNFVQMFRRVIIPLMKNRKEWGHCSDDQRQGLLTTVEKTMDMAKSISVTNEDVPQETLLSVPPQLLAENNNNSIQSDPNMINLLESTVSNWMVTIENLIVGFSQDSR